MRPQVPAVRGPVRQRPHLLRHVLGHHHVVVPVPKLPQLRRGHQVRRARGGKKIEDALEVLGAKAEAYIEFGYMSVSTVYIKIGGDLTFGNVRRRHSRRRRRALLGYDVMTRTAAPCTLAGRRMRLKTTTRTSILIIAPFSIFTLTGHRTTMNTSTRPRCPSTNSTRTPAACCGWGAVHKLNAVDP
jgi:hypothetical protein